MKKKLILLIIVIILFVVGISKGFYNKGKYFNFPSLSEKIKEEVIINSEKVKIVSEESIVIDVVNKVSPSVVTVAISKNQKVIDFGSSDFVDPFSFFQQPSQKNQKIEQDIGSGFIVSADGLIVTNKHVVSDNEAKYKIITKDDKTYQVIKIFRDPANDLAILKIEASNLKPVELGDSSKIKVGQIAIAIGTALGEFRNTVTKGLVSGMGRGITAGNPIEGDSEKLDNVIQTDAAINPGNSGGPLLNSSGQVIGVNTAIVAGGENIGFAIPINTVKESLNNFNNTGKFSRPYLGVKYRLITRKLSLLNEIPEGVYIDEVVFGSPAEIFGIKQGDIITKINGKQIRETDGGLSKIVSGKKVGEKIEVEIWREEKTFKVNVALGENTGE